MLLLVRRLRKRDMHMTLVILAAGIGSRYGGLKQMDPVGPSGEFIVDYSVFDAIRAGFDGIVFVIRREIETAFRTTIGKRIEKHAAVSYVCQETNAVPPGFRVPAARTKPWGTGQAVLTAASAVDGPFGVVNADDFYGRESFAMLARFLERTADDPSAYCMVAFTLRNTLSAHGLVARGICACRPDGKLKAAVERTKIERFGGGARYVGDDGEWQALSGDEPVSMNMWGFKPSLFKHLEREFRAFLELRGADPAAEFYIPAVVTRLIESGEVTTSVLRTPERWFGVTYPQEKAAVAAAVAELIRRGAYRGTLWE
jgi:UTP-glucose-1-phosphate uridylyltransferase